jgi:hypothetical protein
VEECVWAWDSETLAWSRLQAPAQLGAKLEPRFDHRIFLDEAQDLLVLHGGRTKDGDTASTETWLYTFDTLAWTAMPPSPAPAVASAYAAGVLYAISYGDGMGGTVHMLDIQPDETERAKPGALTWKTTDFPSNPLTPGPKRREGGVLVPVTTGMGRVYLVYMFGEARGAENEFCSDIWVLQPPASGPAKVKDVIRDKIPVPGIDSGEMSWAEMELVPEEKTALEGKAHPGPRGLFGADVLEGKNVVFWGGASPKGLEDDGWILRIQ